VSIVLFNDARSAWLKLSPVGSAGCIGSAIADGFCAGDDAEPGTNGFDEAGIAGKVVTAAGGVTGVVGFEVGAGVVDVVGGTAFVTGAVVGVGVEGGVGVAGVGLAEAAGVAGSATGGVTGVGVGVVAAVATGAVQVWDVTTCMAAAVCAASLCRP
jgi:hypothetical protein